MADLPQGCVARYRIMTERSILGFGKYADLTAGDVLRLDETYLVWAYYTLEKVSFCDEILDLLQVSRIPKPGTSEEGWRKWQNDFYNAMSDEQRFRYRQHIRAKCKAIAVEKAHKVAMLNAPGRGVLQAINHGRGTRSYIASDGVTVKRG